MPPPTIATRGTSADEIAIAMRVLSLFTTTTIVGDRGLRGKR
jgi:hypothetical protein